MVERKERSLLGSIVERGYLNGYCDVRGADIPAFITKLQQEAKRRGFRFLVFPQEPWTFLREESTYSLELWKLDANQTSDHTREIRVSIPNLSVEDIERAREAELQRQIRDAEEFLKIPRARRLGLELGPSFN